jgi:hypothetical protein
MEAASGAGWRGRLIHLPYPGRWTRHREVFVHAIHSLPRRAKSIQCKTNFRRDRRLDVFPVELPPLHNRRSDIPQLVNVFLERFANKFGRKIDAVHKETMDLLMDLPGRETFPRFRILSNVQSYLQQSLFLLSTQPFSQEPTRRASFATQPLSHPQVLILKLRRPVHDQRKLPSRVLTRWNAITSSLL